MLGGRHRYPTDDGSTYIAHSYRFLAIGDADIADRMIHVRIGLGQQRYGIAVHMRRDTVPPVLRHVEFV